MPTELECDQCVVEAIANYGSPYAHERLNQINPADPTCPKCKVRLCDHCFKKDHIWCTGVGEGMTPDLAVISRARAEGDSAHAVTFFKEEYHHIIEALRPTGQG